LEPRACILRDPPGASRERSVGKGVTEVEPVSDFWEAEPAHQDYLEKRPGGHLCHFLGAGRVLPKHH
jgi:peptide methionine sulfoxide reductase MsrA